MKYIIGYSKPHKVGMLTATIFVEDPYRELKIVDEEIPADELAKTLEYYKKQYPDNIVCEFVY